MPTFRTSSSGSLSRTCSGSSKSSTSSLCTLPALSTLNSSPVRKQPAARPPVCNIVYVMLLFALAALSFSFGTTGRARTALLYLSQRDIIQKVPFYLTDNLSRRQQTQQPSSVRVGQREGSESGRGADRPEVDLLVGIFTTPSHRRGTYGERREAIRDTFLPELQALPGAAVKFVVGTVRDPLVMASMALEERHHPGTFMHLNIVECYRCLPKKTLAFFLAAAREYNAKWIIKMDDDVYLKPPRLAAAASQWEKIGAEYVGCMKHGEVHAESSHKWYESAWKLLPKAAHMNAYGSIYALSGRAADLVVTRNGGNLRQLGNEDTSIGLWMAAFNVTFFEDMRLCMPNCHLNTIAVLKNECSGLCNPPKDMRRMHRRRNCQRALELFRNGTFPYAPSYPGHNFDHMHAI